MSVAFFWHDEPTEPEEPATVSFAADLQAEARRRGVDPAEVIEVYCRRCQVAGEGAAALFGLGYIHSSTEGCRDEDIKFIRRKIIHSEQEV